MHLCMCPRIRCSRHRESLPRIHSPSSIFQRRKTKRGRAPLRSNPTDLFVLRFVRHTKYSRLASSPASNETTALRSKAGRGLSRKPFFSFFFFSFLRKVIKGIWAKMCETVCKRDKGGTIKSVEFGGIVDDVDIWIYCGFRAGSGVYYLRIDGPANIRTRMLSVTINASANMAFTEQNLDIGHLCEIDPINSNLHALLFIRYECWWSRRTWDHRLNGTW